ncbi:MAG TPA: indolepyruvate oxidoreductase subunit beta [Spirochaetota bacterium]|nr:indolepyruvate oxidoreductase subunit beta [Spirochaetota bacterium]HQQ24156.1 indolepyruvate oxidoreductase subunit beta [Spirochaetota bacterium]
MEKNIIFCGVGGQGVILASKVLMETALRAGYDVKESEVHGMAQRGGSVECCVRFGTKIYSPLIAKGKADYVVSLELLESLRKIEFLSDEGTMIVNDLKIDPVPVQQGVLEYPQDIKDYLNANVKNLFIAETESVLKEIGSQKALNIVMLGILSNYLEFSEKEWLESVKVCVKEKFVEMNIKAFLAGRSLKK